MKSNRKPPKKNREPTKFNSGLSDLLHNENTKPRKPRIPQKKKEKLGKPLQAPENQNNNNNRLKRTVEPGVATHGRVLIQH